MSHLLRTYPKLCTLLLAGTGLLVPSIAFAEFSLSGMLLSVFGLLLWMAAGFFDATVDLFVLQMGGLVTGSGDVGIGIGASIDAVWTMMRDLVNLTFIFGLVYVGFKTILDAGTDTKKILTSIIIGALLVNFSLFITKVVIDVSNLAAVEIYEQMAIGDRARTDPRISDATTSELFLARMGLVNLVSVSNASGHIVEEFKGKDLGGETYFAYVFGALIFILVAAFVFAAGAILLSIRFGVLLILMMLSPIAFAAMVLPGVEKWRDWWWKTLFSQALFAPAYLFMLFITLVIAGGYASKMNDFDKTFVNEGGVFQSGFVTMSFFVITIVMMVASLVIAKQMGAYGASRAVGIGQSMSIGTGRWMKRQAAGAGGMLGNWTLRQGSKAARKVEFSDKAVLRGLRKIPGITPGLQKAGAKYGGDLEKQMGKLSNLRSAQLQNRLDTLMAQGGATPLDRLAVYKTFEKNGDIDELSPDQVRDYFDLLVNARMGTNKLQMLRPDVTFNISKDGKKLDENEVHVNSIARHKNPGDVNQLHKITADKSKYTEQDARDRTKSIDRMADAMVSEYHGGLIAAVGRREDTITEAFVNRLKTRVKGEGLDPTKAADIVTFYTRLAQKSDAENRPERAVKNRAAAEYFRKAPAARLFGLKEDKSRSRDEGGNADEEDHTPPEPTDDSGQVI